MHLCVWQGNRLEQGKIGIRAALSVGPPVDEFAGGRGCNFTSGA
jgi:hypothetical protein